MGLAAASVGGGVPTAVGAPPPEVPSVDAPAVADGATAVRLTPPGRTFTVAAVGDFLAEGLVNNAAAAAARPGVRYDYEPLLRPHAQFVQFADLAICHMETPIGPPGAKVGFVGKGAYGTNLIAAAWETPFDLKRVGFDRCSTASNHANDTGTEGIRTTLEALDAAGLSHTGTARTVQESAVSTFPVNGVRVAHLSYARNSNTGFPRDEWRLNRAITADKVLADVAQARRIGAEVVIVSLHVYVEMQTGPTADDRALVSTITRVAKPDLVLIHGPHVPQPVERVNGVTTYWSLGNYISGMGVAGRNKYSDPRTLDGLMALVRFTQQRDGRWLVEPWTVLLCNALGSRVVYPGITTVATPGISSTLRSQMQACITRTSAVVSLLR
jgi:Bacterial capsule synthesis protein PGA_cap